MKRWGVAAASTLGVAVALLSGTPAAAHHNEIHAQITFDGCTLSGTSEWELADHQAENAVLAVRAAGEVYTAPIGTPLEVQLPPGTTTVEWWAWGGGERGYDNPPVTNLDELLAHIEAGGSPLDADAPGVGRHIAEVPDCPGTPPTEPAPTEEPTGEPTTAPTGEPTESPAPGQAGEQLPVTGSPLPLLASAGAAVLTLGAGLMLVARRRSMI